MNRFDRRLWRHFWSIARLYWSSEKRRVASAMLGGLVVLLLAQAGFSVLFNDQSGELTSALAARDGDRFWLTIRRFGGLLLVAVPINAFYYYVRDRLSVEWRRWLTGRFTDRYFADRAYYDLVSNSEIDNPDQRIAEDINSFTQKSLSFLMVLVYALLQLGAFSRVLWSISHPLVYFLVVYALLGTFVTFKLFGRVLIGLNFHQIRREADLRFSLVRVRENAESIAFYRGEARESVRVKQQFSEVFRNYLRLIRAQLNLNFFQYAYNFLTLVLPGVIIAPRVLSGELEVGRVVQATGAFTAILSALTVFVENFEGLSRFAAGIDRLYTFAHVLEPRPAPGSPEEVEADGTRIRTVEGPRLGIDKLTVMTPNRARVLVRELSLVVEPGEGLLIAGTSGGGKSSLLRAVAGLWTAGSGTIARPSLDELLFLPQQPYMVLGSLRGQLLYPKLDRAISDEELLEVLERVNLPDTASRVGGLDVELDWAKVLSVGEQQRVAFARVLLARPRYAMLDEATSALDRDNEEALYRLLAGSQTTLISVSHRETILKYHRQVLWLDGTGGWSVHDAEGYRFEE